MSEDTKQDGKKKNPVASVLKFAAILVVAYIASNVVFSLLDFGGSATRPDVGWATIIPAILLSVFFVLALHEVGHLIGGKLSGGRVVLFIVGPLKLQATADGLRPYLNKSLAMAGGLAGTAPTNSKNLRLKMALMTAGGPAMSFVVAGAAYAASTLTLSGGFAGTLMIAVTFMSAMIGLITLVPLGNGGFKTDGSRLLMLYRNGPDAKRWCAIAALGGASMLGERPREWDESLIETSLSPADGSLDDAGASLTAAHHALDLGRIDEAASLLSRAMEATDVPDAIKTQAMLENAFFRAYFEGDAEASRELYTRAKSGVVFEEQLRMRAESAVLLAENEVGEAKCKARRALKSLGDSMSPGAARLEREWLEELEEGKSAHSPSRTSPR